MLNLIAELPDFIVYALFVLSGGSIIYKQRSQLEHLQTLASHFALFSLILGTFLTVAQIVHNQTVDKKNPVHLSYSEVCELQRILRKYKYYFHNLDCLFGPATLRALNEFQRRNNLYVTAHPSKQTMDFVKEVTDFRFD